MPRPKQISSGLFGCLAAVALLATIAVPQHRLLAEERDPPPRACPAAGTWMDPANGRRLSHQDVIASAAEAEIVLLGEAHDQADHHRWQLSVLAGLRAKTDRLVIGFESFPRSVQPALDTWVEGAWSDATFLRKARWSEVWGLEPGLYLPLFDFARLYRLPMVALNVERTLVSRVGQEGWAAVPAEEREGVGDPKPASTTYRFSLGKVYQQHVPARSKDGAHGEGEKLSLEEAMALPAFERFVDAQLTWDRAMAEALATARARSGAPQVVGIVGSGHLQNRHGIPHQLADLGVENVKVLLPMSPAAACETLNPGLADAVFVVERQDGPKRPRPRLGVIIETAEEGVRIRDVAEGSVAAAAELQAGDLVREAAGQALERHSELIEIVQRQAPGTWLPMRVQRGEETLDVVARFPTAFE
ncbi:MAG: ChaN family lipoprotein [Kiloniellales bacterium]|nr:ChaN family lipoprotein [Kiloniellales bacterium]